MTSRLHEEWKGDELENFGMARVVAYLKEIAFLQGVTILICTVTYLSVLFLT